MMSGESLDRYSRQIRFPQLGEDGQRALLGSRVALCGCGALGCEALSRGAGFVTFVDQSGDSLDLVRANVANLKEEKNSQILRSDSTQLPPAPRRHRVVFMDPPYKSGLAPKSLASLAAQGWLEDGALIIVEVSAREDLAPPAGYSITDSRDYGNSRVYFLRYTA